MRHSLLLPRRHHLRREGHRGLHGLGIDECRAQGLEHDAERLGRLGLQRDRVADRVCAEDGLHGIDDAVLDLVEGLAGPLVGDFDEDHFLVHVSCPTLGELRTTHFSLGLGKCLLIVGMNSSRKFYLSKKHLKAK